MSEEDEHHDMEINYRLVSPGSKDESEEARADRTMERIRTANRRCTLEDKDIE